MALWLAGFAPSALAQFARPVPIAAGAVQRKAPVYMIADKMGYDQTNKIVIAEGHVEVSQGETVMFADRIEYYQDKDIVRARGNVTMLEPNGNVVFADDAQLNNALKTGVIQNFRARMTDNSLLAARQADRPNPNTIVMKNAVYSPCKVCRDSIGRGDAPLWQVRAKKVTYDTEDERIIYKNAFFDVYGVPVIYTPYLSHPAPNADRKSGILTPEYSHSSNLGFGLKVPYYVNISPDKDVTITPWLLSDVGPVIAGEYRQRTDRGNFAVQGSATNPKKLDSAGNEISGHEFRGHIFARGEQDFAEHWTAGFDINRASDDTYLRRYGFSSEDTLTSRLYTERLEKRDYFSVQGLAFQGLRAEDDRHQIPLVVPKADLHVESDPFLGGARGVLAANALSLTRDVGTDMRRIGMDGSLKKSFITGGGQVIDTEVGARVDGYSVDHLQLAGSAQEFEGEEKRVVPRAAATWHYPMIKYVNNASLTLEPVVQVVASTNGNNSRRIPNEDSQLFDFSDVNLFSVNRQIGWDRVDNGTRATYGVRGELDVKGRHHLNFLVGQNYMIDGDPLDEIGQGDGEHFSDYVGEVGYESDYLQADYRFWLAEDSLALRRTELMGLLTTRYVDVNLDYIYVNDDPMVQDIHEIFGATTVRLTDKWSVNGYARRDLRGDEMRAAGGSVIWTNECLSIATRVSRDFYRDRDIEPGTSYTVRLGLKNLD